MSSRHSPDYPSIIGFSNIQRPFRFPLRKAFFGLLSLFLPSKRPPFSDICPLTLTWCLSLLDHILCEISPYPSDILPIRLQLRWPTSILPQDINKPWNLHRCFFAPSLIATTWFSGLQEPWTARCATLPMSIKQAGAHGISLLYFTNTTPRRMSKQMCLPYGLLQKYLGTASGTFLFSLGTYRPRWRDGVSKHGFVPTVESRHMILWTVSIPTTNTRFPLKSSANAESPSCTSSTPTIGNRLWTKRLWHTRQFEMMEP